MKLRGIALVVLIAGGGNSLAQDVHFSQFKETPLLINPAMTGVYNGHERFIINHKSQWVALGSPFRTTNASFDLPVYFDRRKEGAHIGVGVGFYNDRAGDSQFGLNQGNLNFSGILPTGELSSFSAGIQIGFAQRSGQLDNLTWGSQFDGTGFNTDIPSNEVNTLNSFVYADLGAGIHYEFDNTEENLDGYSHFKLNAGAAVFHANRPVMRFTNSNDEQLSMKYVFHARLRWDIPASTVSLVPQVMYAMQGPHSEILAGTYLRFQLRNGTKFTGLIQENALNIGIQIRGGDAVIPMVLVELSDFAIGLSYDISTSSIGAINSAAGGFELTLRYVNLKDALWKRR